MDWLSQNWVWVLIFIAFFGMHMFGHGGHGGHGRSGGHKRPGTDPGESSERGSPPGHRH